MRARVNIRRSRMAVSHVTALQTATPQAMSVSATTAGKSLRTASAVRAQVA